MYLPARFLLSCIGNDLVISRVHPEPEIRRIAIKVVDEIVRPMVELDVDETEYACLKAIVFFNPGNRGFVVFCMLANQLTGFSPFDSIIWDVWTFSDFMNPIMFIGQECKTPIRWKTLICFVDKLTGLIFRKFTIWRDKFLWKWQ